MGWRVSYKSSLLSCAGSLQSPTPFSYSESLQSDGARTRQHGVRLVRIVIAELELRTKLSGFFWSRGDHSRHATLENRISVHATKTITDAEANFEEAWKREVQMYHKEVKQRVRRLDNAIIYVSGTRFAPGDPGQIADALLITQATVCCFATFLSLRLDRCLGLIGRCNIIRGTFRIRFKLRHRSSYRYLSQQVLT